MFRVRAVAAVCIATFAAAIAVGCTSVAPDAGPPPPAPMSMMVRAAPADIMLRLKREAVAQGAAVVRETADSFSVDWGIQTRRVRLPASGSLPGADATYCETEVHESARYGVRSARDGCTLVSITHTPTWWHPRLRCWFPGPFEPPPAPETTGVGRAHAVRGTP